MNSFFVLCHFDSPCGGRLTLINLLYPSFIYLPFPRQFIFHPHSATEELKSFKERHPECERLRIFVMSDGGDTKSEAAPSKVARDIRSNGIVVDAVTIGDEEDMNLRAIVHATGGFAFRPRALRDLLRLCELETVQSLAARAPAALPPASHLRDDASLLALAAEKRYDDIDATPGLREPLLSVNDGAASASARSPARQPVVTSALRGPSNIST